MLLAAQFPAEASTEGAFVRQAYTICTVNLDHIKRHYYLTHDALNPGRIIPTGPSIDWTAPHDRGRLSA